MSSVVCGDRNTFRYMREVQVRPGTEQVLIIYQPSQIIPKLCPPNHGDSEQAWLTTHCHSPTSDFFIIVWTAQINTFICGPTSDTYPRPQSEWLCHISSDSYARLSCLYHFVMSLQISYVHMQRKIWIETMEANQAHPTLGQSWCPSFQQC